MPASQPAQPDLSALISILAAFTPFLLALIGSIGWLYRHERERRENAERQLSDRKNKVYIDLLEIFFEQFKAQRRKTEVDYPALVEKMVDVNKELVLYGSDEVVRIYHDFMVDGRSGNLRLSMFGELFLAIRRDMGHTQTKLTPDQIMRQFITDYDEAKAKGIVR